MHHHTLFKRGIPFAVVGLLLVSFSISNAFTDTDGHYNEEAIEYLADEAVIEGYSDGSYGPDNTINRAEFVKILIQSRYPSQDEGTDCFPDVGGEWFSSYVCYAKDLGIISGYEDGYFQPANNINLAEAMKIVIETYEIEFTQYSDTWLWYIPYHRTALDLDLLDRIGAEVDHEITRGEMAQFIFNVEHYLEEEDDDDQDEDSEDEEEEDQDDDSEDDHDHDDDSGNDEDDDELTFDDSIDVDSIPNVVILEFDEDDEWRHESTGNVEMAGVVERFYEDQDDDFDMLLIITANDSYNGKGNGYSDGNIYRYRPLNVGFSQESSFGDATDYCSSVSDTSCESFPERLRYMQQTGTNYSGYIFNHELGHYWSAKWYQGKNDSCYDQWAQNVLYNGHWTVLSVLGDTTSPVSISTSEIETGEAVYGEFYDNGDGTFSNISYFNNEWRVIESAFNSGGLSELKFNNMDLYAMGLMDEEDLASHEMYVLDNPVFQSWDSSERETVITADRIDITLDDFKDLLLDKESCEGTGSDYYFTGDGSREVNPNDPHPDFAENPHVGIVLIKYPDETISSSTAYTICQVVNYEWPAYWSHATSGLSEVDLTIDGDDPTPDCAALYAE